MDCEKVSYSSSCCMAFRKPKQSLLVTKENFVYLVALRWHFQFQICLLWGVIILACLEDFCRFVFWVHNGSSEQFWSNKSKGNCELLNVFKCLSSTKKYLLLNCRVILILPIAIFHHFLNISKPWVKCHKRNRRHHSEKVFLNIFTSWDDVATWIMLMLESKSRPSILIAIIKAPLLSWET